MYKCAEIQLTGHFCWTKLSQYRFCTFYCQPSIIMVHPWTGHKKTFKMTTYLLFCAHWWRNIQTFLLTNFSSGFNTCVV